MSALEITARDGAARCGVLHTPHGTARTPAFMAVGTQGTVKGLTPKQVRGTGTEIWICNAYHLSQRPGGEMVRRLGGLHRLTGWDGPLATDSGGFQVYSMADCLAIGDDGVTFRSHVDGSEGVLTPAGAVRLQKDLGSDLLMVLDDCPALPAEPARLEQAVARTLAWARIAREESPDDGRLLFAIVQGGTDPALRRRCAEALAGMNFPAYAIGGFAVGESTEGREAVLQAAIEPLPEGRPRYLMGLGWPEDLLEAVATGVDLFDCVLPTRNGRNGCALTFSGKLLLKNRAFAYDDAPIEAGCDCEACRDNAFPRAVLRHLLRAEEMLGMTLVSIHNLRFVQRLMERIRASIAEGRFDALRASLAHVRWSR